jgi:hypothetical protein
MEVSSRWQISKNKYTRPVFDELLLLIEAFGRIFILKFAGDFDCLIDFK